MDAHETGQTPSVRVSAFADLRQIDLSGKVAKKGGLTYLPWASALDELLQREPSATWEFRDGVDFHEVAGQPVSVTVPYVRIGNTAMVFCTVHAFGISRTAQLPVMDHRNKPIPNPDAFQVNTAMQRCLVKAIGMHGIGLYIYEGEDLPEEPPKKEPPKPKLTAQQIKDARLALSDCESVEELRKTFNAMDDVHRQVLREYADSLKAGLEAKTV